ncbi:MAG: alpha/beta fold hydrolase [Myxococcota bacterium]
MSMKLTLAGFGSLFALFTISCGDECDPNTENRDGVCIARAESTCSEGTQLVAGACIASAEACADGTAFSNGRCEPLTRGCAAGTSFDAARLECISNRQIVCGPGTFQRGTECVRNADGSALDSTVAVEGFGDIALRAPLADGTGPLIVLFHGIYGGVSHRSYRELASVLDDLGARVFLLDLPGTGESDKREFVAGEPVGVRTQYTSALVAEFFERFVRDVVSEPAILVAESSSTMSLLDAATRLGPLAADLILFSPTGVNVQSSPPTAQQNAFYDALVSDDSGLREFYVNGLLSDANIEAIVRPGFVDQSLVTESLFDEYRLGRGVLDQRWISVAFSASQIFSSFSEVRTGVTQPVLMVFGDEDRGVVAGAGPGDGTLLLAEPDREADFRAIEPNYDYLTLPRLGQIFWKEQPELVAELILSRNREVAEEFSAASP